MQRKYGAGAVLVAIAIAATPLGATAQDSKPEYHKTYDVPDWRQDASSAAVEYKTYWTIVMANPSYSDDDKAKKIAEKYSAIEKQVREKRKAEYSAVTRFAAVGNSCTNASSSTKNCAPNCVGEPLPAMYTSLAWVQGWWGGDVDPASLKPNANQMGDDRVSGDTHICAGKLKASGKGRKTSYAEGTFRIRPDRIDQIVNEEMVPVMSIVSAAVLGG